MVGALTAAGGLDVGTLRRWRDAAGSATLVFHRELAPEGRLGFWRWLSLFLGVAGTYRKNDTVDIVYSDGGGRRVLTLEPHAPRDR